MKGLLIFVAGLLCGGAAVAWLFLGRDEAPPPAVESTLPAPGLGPDGATGLEPGAADPALPPVARDPHEAPDIAIDPLDRVDVPPPEIAPLPDAPAATPDAMDAPADAATAPQVKSRPNPDVLAALRATTLLLPVQGITPTELQDTYSDARGEGRSHDAIDIMAPTGRPVRAVADGTIAKLFASVPGGLTIYQFDGDERLAYYYAHLDRYAQGVDEGDTVKRGDVIGYVGASGNANKDAPHLHFAIFVLGPEKRWWQGTPVNPYPVLKRADTEVVPAP